MSSLNVLPASSDDYRRLAEARLPRMFFDYIDGGSYDEVTLAANRADFLALKLRQRVMRDVSRLDTSCTVVGQPLKLPVILAPLGLAGAWARRGEVQALRAAEAAGVPFCLSTVGICSLEELSAAASKPFWFQLYMMRDRGYVRELLQRARAVGCSALVFTVDLAVVGARYSDTRNGMAGQVPPGDKLRMAANLLRHPSWIMDVAVGGKPLVFGNLASYVPGANNLAAFKTWVDHQFDPAVTWKDIEWLRQEWDGPLIIKGVLDPDDARAAADCGAQAVVVSNHGGRQLDSVTSSIAMLPKVVEAVGDRLEVLMDGGVRNGLDVIKAMALGARAVMIGRAWAWALAAQGEPGVRNLLASMQRGAEVGLALTGQPSISQLGREVLEG